MDNIRIVVADDQQLICEGIRIILSSQPGIEVIATAGSGAEAVAYVQEMKPDVALLDIQMPGMSGFEALREIKEKSPYTKVLILTTFDPDNYIIEAFRSGADGYLLKDMTGDKLAAAIRDAHAGNVTIPASIAARIIAQLPVENRRKTLAAYGLTQREQEIAGLIAKGVLNHKIAETLNISLGTVKNYVSTLYSKLEVKSRSEAILIITGMRGSN